MRLQIKSTSRHHQDAKFDLVADRRSLLLLMVGEGQSVDFAIAIRTK
jgi:hypothetical protein